MREGLKRLTRSAFGLRRLNAHHIKPVRAGLLQMRLYSGYRKITDPAEQSLIYSDAKIESYDSVTTAPDAINSACANMSAKMWVPAIVFLQKAEELDKEKEYTDETDCIRRQLENPDSERCYHAFEPEPGSV